VTGRVELWTGAVLLTGLVMLATAVPWLGPDPDATDYANRLTAPGPSHLLGTDQAGRDVLARAAAGVRTSMGAAVLVTVISAAAGLVVGVTAALVGGVVDAVLSRLVDVVLAVPQLVLALAVVGVLGPGLPNLVVAMALAGWAPLARYARTFATGLLHRPYVVAAELAGVSRPLAALRHVVPATTSGVVAVATLGLGEVVLGLAGLSFLGLGVAPPTAEWGQMVAESTTVAGTAPWLVVVPGVLIVLSVACASLLGDALNREAR
jgi:ABC-type dipeptide/oligopeptide/nickel transport system permease subunit